MLLICSAMSYSYAQLLLSPLPHQLISRSITQFIVDLNNCALPPASIAIAAQSNIADSKLANTATVRLVSPASDNVALSPLPSVRAPCVVVASIMTSCSSLSLSDHYRRSRITRLPSARPTSPAADASATILSAEIVQQS